LINLIHVSCRHASIGCITAAALAHLADALRDRWRDDQAGLRSLHRTPLAPAGARKRGIAFCDPPGAGRQALLGSGNSSPCGAIIGLCILAFAQQRETAMSNLADANAMNLDATEAALLGANISDDALESAAASHQGGRVWYSLSFYTCTPGVCGSISA
jgi:hypothetical protein